MPRKRFPSDDCWTLKHRTSRARARYSTRAVNIAMHALEGQVAKDWADMTETEQLAWARNRLRELAEGAEDEKVQANAGSALARSLEASVMAAKVAEAKAPTANPIQDDRAYLEAVGAEVAARLAAMEKTKS